MSEYIKFYDEAPRWLRVVMSVLWVPAFLYRLFYVILEKAKDTPKLIFLICSALPFIGTVVLVFDIVWCALRRKLPREFADWLNPTPNDGSPEVIDAIETSSEEKKD